MKADVAWKTTKWSNAIRFGVLRGGAADVCFVYRQGVDMDMPPVRSQSTYLELVPQIGLVQCVDRDFCLYVLEETGALVKYDVSQKKLIFRLDLWRTGTGYGVGSGHRTFDVSPDGIILVVYEHGGVLLLDREGNALFDIVEATNTALLSHPRENEPYSEMGALSVSCGQDYFAVGCWLRNSVDVLTYQGKMVERIYRSAEVGIAYPYCCMDAWGRLWITDGQQLDVYQVFANRVEHLAGCTDFPALVNEGDVRLEDCFKVDRQGLLWTVNDETYLGIRVTF